VAFSQPWVPIGGDKMAFGRCQVLLAGPRAAAGLGMVQGGEVLNGRTPARVPTGSMLGDLVRVDPQTPSPLGHAQHSACWIQRHEDPVCGHGAGRCLGGSATGLAPGRRGLGAGLAHPGRPHLQLLELTQILKCVYVYTHIYVYKTQ